MYVLFSVRNKRHVSALPFLGGVAIGGIFGPILYNRLYGWRPVKVEQGWQAPQQGWAPPVQQGWQAAAPAVVAGGYH